MLNAWMQRSNALRSVYESAGWASRYARRSSARRSSDKAGMRPFGGSTTSDVRRSGPAGRLGFPVPPRRSTRGRGWPFASRGSTWRCHHVVGPRPAQERHHPPLPLRGRCQPHLFQSRRAELRDRSSTVARISSTSSAAAASGSPSCVSISQSATRSTSRARRRHSGGNRPPPSR